MAAAQRDISIRVYGRANQTSPYQVDLHAYPWERPFVQWQGSAIPLAASSLILFSRFIPLEEKYKARCGPVNYN